MALSKIEWLDLQIEDPTELEPSIRYLHRAIQFLAAAGQSLLPPQPDDSHTALTWSTHLQSMISPWLRLDIEFRLALNYEKFELVVLDQNDQPLDMVPLTGQTQAQVLGYLKQITQKYGGDPDRFQPISHYQLPLHELDQKGVFQIIDPEHHREMIRYRTNMTRILEKVCTYFEHTSTVQVWPHHFDSAVLVRVGSNETEQASKTIGIGFAIPDESCSAPYFYINHWAKNTLPTPESLPKLPGGGVWIPGKHPFAALSMTEVVKRSTADQQKRQIAHFIEEGINASLEMIQESTFKIKGEITI